MSDEPRQYWVRNDRGKMWGPLTFATIELLISNGLIPGRLQASRDGLNFVFPGRLPDLRDAFPKELWGDSTEPLPDDIELPGGPIAPPAGPPVVGAPGAAPPPEEKPARRAAQPPAGKRPSSDEGMPDSGDLGTCPPLFLYYLAATGNDTGLLRLEAGEVTYEIFFKKGSPEAVSSSRADEDLGAFLVKQGAIKDEQLADARGIVPNFGGSIVNALFSLQLLSPADAFKFIGEHAQSLLPVALQLGEGSFVFDREAKAPATAMPLGDRWGLVASAAREMPLEVVRERLGDKLQWPVMKSGGRVEIDKLKLNAQEARAASYFDGVHSVDGLCEMMPAESETIVRTAFLLSSFEALSFAEGATPTKPKVAADKKPDEQAAAPDAAAAAEPVSADESGGGLPPSVRPAPTAGGAAPRPGAPAGAPPKIAPPPGGPPRLGTPGGAPPKVGPAAGVSGGPPRVGPPAGAPPVVGPAAGAKPGAPRVVGPSAGAKPGAPPVVGPAAGAKPGVPPVVGPAAGAKPAAPPVVGPAAGAKPGAPPVVGPAAGAKPAAPPTIGPAAEARPASPRGVGPAAGAKPAAPPAVGPRVKAEPAAKAAAGRTPAKEGGEDLAGLKAHAAGLKGKSHFEILDIPKDAGLGQIKTAFFKLAKAYHPDTLPADTPPEIAKVKADIFALVNEAYRVLSDEKLRAEYLAKLEAESPEKLDAERIAAAEQAFQKGCISVKARKLDDALALFDEAIGLNDKEGEVFAWRGWARFLAGKDKAVAKKEAFKDLETAIKLNPKCAHSYFFVGQITKMTGDAASALKWFKKALSVDPNHLDAQREVRLASSPKK
ncbi:MAG: DnaJ domain-containing protein [Myxococcales bacterium]|jgi:DnaJ-domain-containing protein 1